MSQNNPTDAEVDAYAGHYALHGDQSAAWREAFPDSKCKPETVHAKASAFHKHDKVLVRIEHYRQAAREISDKVFDMTAEQIKSKLIEIANKGMELVGGDEKTEGRPMNLNAAIRALREVNIMDGNHAATKLALGGDPDAPPIETAVTVTKRYINADGA